MTTRSVLGHAYVLNKKWFIVGPCRAIPKKSSLNETDGSVRMERQRRWAFEYTEVGVRTTLVPH